MSGTEAALLLAILTGFGCLVMIAFVGERKLRRDKREWLSRHTRDRLREGVIEADRDVIRAAAARAVGAAGPQVDFAVAISGVVDGLRPKARKTLDSTVRELGLPESLVEQLGGRDSVARGRAALLLGELRLPEAEEELPGLLDDDDPDVRLVACAELGGLASDRAARSLISALMADLLPPERIIERLAGAWAVPTMVAVLEDPELAASLEPTDRERSPRWRPAVARALGVAGDSKAELTLARMLDSEAAEERVAAARALGPSGSAASVAVLIAALDDPAWEVRAQAAKALAFHPTEQAVPSLEERLTDQAWWVRSNAADALAAEGPAGVEALKRALSSTDRFARERAQEALALNHLAEA